MNETTAGTCLKCGAGSALINGTCTSKKYNN